MSRRWTRWAAGVAAAAFVLASAPAAVANDGQADPLVYVALGDSYVSYPLVPIMTDINCTRSNQNYASLVAVSIGADVFRDVSCGGATTNEMFNGWNGTAGLFSVPPQLDAVTADTDIVTVGIGGNDEGFFAELTTGKCLNLLPAPFGKSCIPFYTQGGVNYFSDILTRTDDRVAAVIQEIHNRAPNAQVFVVGEPAVTPEQGGCWSPRVPYLNRDVPFMHSVELELNQMFAEVAAANGATFVDTRANSIGHDVCRPIGTRYVEGLIPDLIFHPAAPFHPNGLAGPSQAADIVAAINS